MPHGKICYLEIPAADIDLSAAFYQRLFAWNSRTRGDGSCAFDDTTGGVSGSWTLERKPSREPGVLAFVMVDSIEDTLQAIVAAGGRVATPHTPLTHPGEAFAIFRDPAGNTMGLYQARASDGAG